MAPTTSLPQDCSDLEEMLREKDKLLLGLFIVFVAEATLLVAYICYKIQVLYQRMFNDCRHEQNKVYPAITSNNDKGIIREVSVPF